jgi:hypothetical protein
MSKLSMSLSLQWQSRSLPVSQSPRVTADVLKPFLGQVVIGSPAGQAKFVGTVDNDVIVWREHLQSLFHIIDIQ